MVERYNDESGDKRLSFDFKRRQFLKGVGFLGAGAGAFLADHILHSAEAEATETHSSAELPPTIQADSIVSQATGEIPRRPLGRTGVQVSAIGLGVPL